MVNGNNRNDDGGKRGKWAAIAIWALVVLLGLACFLVGGWCTIGELVQTGDKPVVYLYPEDDMQVHVELRVDGRITVSYPEYPDGGWDVTAHPDGTVEHGGKSYRYLYWEGEGQWEPDFSTGFLVTPDVALDFLEEKLAVIGLTDYEAQEMIVYWLPELLSHEYSLVSFQTEAYTDWAGLVISPEPDSLLRAFMSVKPVDGPVEIGPQTFEPFVREGFTVVEWGGNVVLP